MVITTQFPGTGARLPRELLDDINSYIIGGRLESPHFIGSVPSSVCLVNSLWYQIYNPMLYHRYQFHGSPNQVKSLWCFLRTIVRRPDLAQLVQELTLTTCELYNDFTPRDVRAVFDILAEDGDPQFLRARTLDQWATIPSDPDQRFEWLSLAYLDCRQIRGRHQRRLKKLFCRALYHLNRPWLDQAMRGLGFHQHVLRAENMYLNFTTIAHLVLEAGKLSMGYQCPLTAILIAFCPKIVRLNFDTWGFGEDPYFELIMAYATGTQPLPAINRTTPPLGNLEALNVGGRCHSEVTKTELIRYESPISDTQPYPRLPALKALTVLNAVAPRPLTQPLPQTKIERLTLNAYEIRELELPTLLSATPTLRQLSLDMPSRRSNDGPRLHAWLWPMLYQFKDQLEYLDLRQGSFPFSRRGFPFFRHTDNLNPFCPPLRHFLTLRQLSLTLVILAGHDCKHDAPSKLRNHLPPNLQSLGLYVDDAYAWMLQYIHQLEEELEGIAIAGSYSQGGRLRSIICDKTYNEDLPTQKMEAVTARNGIFFDSNAGRYLFFAGEETLWGDLNEQPPRLAVDKVVRRDPARVIPRGMEVNGYRGRLSQ